MPVGMRQPGLDSIRVRDRIPEGRPVGTSPAMHLMANVVIIADEFAAEVLRSEPENWGDRLREAGFTAMAAEMERMLAAASFERVELIELPYEKGAAAGVSPPAAAVAEPEGTGQRHG